MKTIIVPTDFSAKSKYALELALDIATTYDYQVVLVHIIDMPALIQTLYFANYGDDELNEEAKKNAHQKLQEIRAQYHHEKLVTAVFVGKLPDLIKDIESDYDSKLIVMGTTGASGFKEAFVGSNTERVVRYTKTPTLAVPGSVKITDIKNIVIPTNGEDVHEGFFNEIKKMQKMLSFNITILYVNALHSYENEEEVKRRLKEYSEKARLENCEVEIIRSIDNEIGITEYIKEKNIDMVAIATHGRMGLNHLMYGSLTEDLINHLDKPVFSYNLRLNK